MELIADRLSKFALRLINYYEYGVIAHISINNRYETAREFEHLITSLIDIVCDVSRVQTDECFKIFTE